MTSAPDPVGVGSNGTEVTFGAGATPEMMREQINAALDQVKTDIQRLAGLTQKGVTAPVSSGTPRLVAPGSGVLRVTVISDTATAASTAANYHTFTLRRNGVAANGQTADTRRAEVPAYLGGAYLGEVATAQGDIISVSVTVTGAPSPVLTTANLSLSCTLRSN